MNNITNDVISSDAIYIKLRDIVSTGEHLVKGIRIIDSDQVNIIIGEYPTLYMINVDRRQSLAVKRNFSLTSVLTLY